jgi:YVTN family beta-propeller protein
MLLPALFAQCTPMIRVGEIAPCATDGAPHDSLADAGNDAGADALLDVVDAGADSTDAPTDTPDASAPRISRTLSVYITNSTSNDVAVFDVDDAGGLRRTQTVSTGETPYGITVDRDGRHAYVANATANRVTLYDVDPRSGALRESATTAFNGASHVSLHPSGRWAFVTAFAPGDRLGSFAVDPVSGALSATGSSISAMTSPFNSTVDVTGRFVFFATSRAPFNVWSARVDVGTGALNMASTTPAGTTPRNLIVDPTGRFVYVANIGAGTITQYTIDRSTGALTAGTSASVASPRGLAFSSSGRTLYASSYEADLTGNVATIPVDPVTGALGTITRTPTGGRQTFAVSVDPTGRFLFAVNADSSDVRAFAIDPNTEALTVAGAPVSCGEGPVAVTAIERVVVER